MDAATQAFPVMIILVSKLRWVLSPNIHLAAVSKQVLYFASTHALYRSPFVLQSQIVVLHFDWLGNDKTNVHFVLLKFLSIYIFTVLKYRCYRNACLLHSLLVKKVVT